MGPLATDECDRLYLSLLRSVLADGERVRTRNADCLRAVGRTLTFTRAPLVGVRRTAWRNALREWEWFMSGSNNVADLHPSVRPWWEPWANATGNVPFNYSEQFRAFVGWQGQVDQIELALSGVRDHPFSRRNVLTTWNTCDMVNPATPITNCHSTVVQFHGHPDGSLTLQTYQRSADLVCGLPHNLIQTWAFLLWVCHRTGRTPRAMVWHGGDVHCYGVHEGLARRMAALEPVATPGLVYTPTSTDFKADDFSLDSPYTPTLTERAEMVV